MWRDDAWLLDMLQSARKALGYARGLRENQFMTDSLTLLRGFNPRRRNFARASGWIVNDVGGQIGRIGL
jgi:hypothetical protein